MSVKRIMGTETEFGILSVNEPAADPVDLSTEFVSAYLAQGASAGPRGGVMWDYQGEDPLNDARGFRYDRADVDPSLLTDDPDSPAPSGPGLQSVPRPTSAQLTAPRAANGVLTNGARLYVDHAHPEYSSPETANPREAVLWDRAGEHIAVEALSLVAHSGKNFAIYKNNVDGKGAAYGSHENYAVSRSVEFSDIVRYLTPFMITRPVICGAGRVGIGQKSEYPGFQISQRADYVETPVGIETTFRRPIINTRDEPHADPAQLRRLHVIGGDANLFDVSNVLKIGTTSLVLWMLEQDAVPLALESVVMHDPVIATWNVSHDLTLTERLDLNEGEMTALDIQEIFLESVRAAVDTHGEPDFDTAEILQLWQWTIDTLRRDKFDAASSIEWVGKLRLLEQMRERGGLSWDNDRLRALDLQWHDLRPERSIVAKLDAAGKVRRLFTPSQVAWAVSNAPRSTRAFVRGGLVEKFGPDVVGASWSSVILDAGEPQLVRVPLLHPNLGTEALVGDILEKSATVADFLSQVTKEK
ncbi:proteasome accessory factor A [Arcanobacterium wilhelmae]|uniref:Proteasome accessory factor A n=1 Tax=Arcanobacterium wilhelmae TaxID=1803177 RepID=A0ABT9N8E1_9ACTO|nr:depupylase/deamidase Dop [Arcanobacterium wilhelmae]MDP9799972.1 proteasome accessory factor A [Arcanobacterium wilhelmae]